MTVDPGAADAPVPEATPVSAGMGTASAGTVADLADTLISATVPSSGPDTRPTDGAVLRYGRITAVGTGANVGRAQTDATGVAWVTYDAAYAAQVNDLVYLLMQGPVVHIGGQLGGTQPTPPPVGAIIAFGGPTAPTGWVACAGQALSRTTYATLFGVIGTIYGGGDGSTTFNVPSLVNRVPVGSGSAFARGETGGSETQTLTEAQMPNHDHTMNHDHSTSDHSHSINLGPGSAQAVLTNGTGDFFYASGNYRNTDPANVNVNVFNGYTGGAGSGQSFNNMPPYLALSYILRALP